MDDSTSATIGPIGSSSASSRPSLLDTNMGLVLQLWALKILVHLSHQNLKKVSKHQRFGNILPS